MYILIPSVIAIFALDFYSTIIQGDYHVEENPIIRSIWARGDWAFALAVIAFTALFILFLYLLHKKNKHYPYLSVPFLVFKLLMALTNLGLVSYQLLSWFHY